MAINYYAYGLKIAGISSKKLGDVYEGTLKNNYLYQGAFAELDEDIGWTDFALRNYDAQIGRFVQQDPYQEYASPYLALGNDPVNLIDPSGGSTWPPPGLSTLSTTADKAITLSEVVVRSVSTVSKSVSTVSTLAKVGNIATKAFQVANIINTGINTSQVGRQIEGGGNQNTPKVIAIFFHGGAFENGKQTSVEKSGGAGQIFKNVQEFAKTTNKEFVGAIFAPGFNSNTTVVYANMFVAENYNPGDKIVVYGYSYGGDAAVEFSDSQGTIGRDIELLVTVDSSDGIIGLGVNATVDTEISTNVKENLNLHQTNKTKNTQARGAVNHAKNPNNTNVINKNVTGPGVTHGNIQEKFHSLIEAYINAVINQLPVKKGL